MMMKKMILAVAIVALGTIAANAQDRGFGYGIKAGVNVANLTQDLGGTKSKAGFTGGVFVDYRFNTLFAISADVLYSRQGANDNESSLKTDFLNVPILANFYVFKGLAVKTGLQPGFCLGAKFEGASAKDIFRTADLAIPIGLSYDLPMGLILDVRYNIGLTNVIDSKALKSRNGVWAITAGWRF